MSTPWSFSQAISSPVAGRTDAARSSQRTSQPVISPPNSTITTA